MSTPTPDLFNFDLRCKIDEKAFSRALFVCRLLTGAALIYLAVGSLLYWREFVVNAANLGIPFALPVALGLVMAELFIGLFTLLGWHTHLTAGLGIVVSLICAVVFFAGQYNTLLVVLCLLLSAPLSVLLWLGPGAISLDYKRSQRKLSEFFRG